MNPKAEILLAWAQGMATEHSGCWAQSERISTLVPHPWGTSRTTSAKAGRSAKKNKQARKSRKRNR